MTPPTPFPPCMCKHPRPGPLYWNFRCLRCDGKIVSWWERRRLRKQAARDAA